MTTRRQFIQTGIAVGTGTLLFGGESLGGIVRVFGSVQVSQTPLPGASIPKYVEPLTTFAGKRVKDTILTARTLEFQQKVLPNSIYEAVGGQYRAGTYVWGYQVGQRPPSYPGYTVEAISKRPTIITYVNNLPRPVDSQLEPLLTVDQTIHWANVNKMMGSFEVYKGDVPTVVHLHGSETSSFYDGGPNQWFTRNGAHGSAYATLYNASINSAVYQYLNTQPATALWFHDHALGVTRLNVYAGLATFYLIRDQYDTGLPNNPLRLPSGQQEIELIIQDRMFDTNGQLLFPDGTPLDNPSGFNGSPPNPLIHPYWIPEFFGDVIVVNGKSWPYLDVEPRRYRFRFLNGANARFFQMRLIDAGDQSAGPAFWQIGTDGGLLDTPVELNNPSDPTSLQLFLAPSERADIIIDFAGLSGRTFTLINSAVAPYPSGDLPDLETNGQIMQFRVNLLLSDMDRTYNPANGGALRGGQDQEPAIVRLADPETGTLARGVVPTVRRQLVLIEYEGLQDSPVEVLVNNSKWDGLHDGTDTPIPGSVSGKMHQGIYLTELPRVGSTEIWEFINLTEDAHPIHIHLIQFQLLNRQNFNDGLYRSFYNSLFPGGTYAGIKPDGTWGDIVYAPHTYIPGYGPPLLYNVPNLAGAIGGNPSVNPYLVGGIILPDSNEAGWKDTIKAYPGEVTRLVARWAPQDVSVRAVKPGENLFRFDPTAGPGYVWHCHILDHEDNEMMRPFGLVW